jgi:branched-chain amino acid transport system permease protein
MSLIFGVTRIVNLAHGCFYMVGAYLMVTLVEVLPDRPWAFWLALALAPLGVAALGGVIELGLLRLIYRRDPLMQLILTFGLILVIGTSCCSRGAPTTRACRDRTRSPAR